MSESEIDIEIERLAQRAGIVLRAHTQQIEQIRQAQAAIEARLDRLERAAGIPLPRSQWDPAKPADCEAIPMNLKGFSK